MEDQGPITVVVHHRVKPSREAEFEEWQRGINHASLQFEGHLGFHVVRPADKRGDYLVMFRFNSLANLEKWEKSDERKAWLEKVEPLTAQPPRRERHTGMEVWFTPPVGRKQPPRYKMVVVTFLALYPLIATVQAALVPYLMEWPMLLRAMLTTFLLILVMTYAAMPLMTRLLTGWLYPEE